MKGTFWFVPNVGLCKTLGKEGVDGFRSSWDPANLHE